MADEFGILGDVSEFVVSLADLAADRTGERTIIDSVTVDLPVELAVTVGSDGRVELGSGPPTQRVETSFMPVFHRMKVKVVAQHGFK